MSVCRVAPRRHTRSGQGRGRGPAQPSASPRSTGVPGLVAPFPEASGAPGTRTRPKRSEATAAPRAGTGDRPQDTPCSSCGTRVKPSRETGGGEGEGPTEPEGPSLTSPSHPVWLVASPTFLRSGATGLQQTGHWPSPRCPGSGHGDLQLPQVCTSVTADPRGQGGEPTWREEIARHPTGQAPQLGCWVGGGHPNLPTAQASGWGWGR